jgi:hypothetical protein
MKVDSRSHGGPLLPAREPEKAYGAFERPTYVWEPERGTAEQRGGDLSIPNLWQARQMSWRNGFEQRLGTNARKYWALYRNFNQAAVFGPGQEWRDQTVIPEPFKILSTRVPRLVLGSWGLPETFTVTGRGSNDMRYEEQCRVLLQMTLDMVGENDPECEGFIKRIIDGTWYREVIGHVWWKAWWRTETDWLRTKKPILDEEGKIERWEPIERLETNFDGVDINWLPVSQVAIDLHGKPRRWAIERVRTSLESLIAENERFREQYDRDLYPNLTNLELDQLAGVSRDSFEEPQDTERWPLSDDSSATDPTETPVELWFCWDNVAKTLTKLANSKVVLDHGIAPTPKRTDPFVSDPAIPIPGSPYGDSFLNWTGPLHTRQTRLARARMDETMMNLFQQYVVREGTLNNTTWFFRPGGYTTLKAPNMDRPLTDHIMLLQRRPLPPEAYNEESYLQQQAEATAGADSVSQGVEATQKSRDVTAAEVNQRVLQGASRFQLETLYHDVAMKRPLLNKVFDLLKSNLTQPRIVRVLDDTEGEPIDLTKLDRPIDIVVGSSLFEASQAEKLQELDRLTNMAKEPFFQPVLNAQPIAYDMLKATRTLKRGASKYVKSEEQVKREQAMAQAAALGGSTPNAAPAAPGALPPGAEAGPGAPGGAGLAGPGGSGTGGPATSSGGFGEEEF